MIPHNKVYKTSEWIRIWCPSLRCDSSVDAMCHAASLCSRQSSCPCALISENADPCTSHSAQTILFHAGSCCHLSLPRLLQLMTLCHDAIQLGSVAEQLSLHNPSSG
ncbi:hypothetical protein CBR_g19476 [Chara braunii]|uniref:Uncharacterized protein n=1 Tax=Chara braunii TaxID=69332 RepID=A0A388KYE3_CHABU|nr:hypothetical protein CBR_g19476 [Chara braunii]|eukprot:GBG74963.1 hypothetical protein CBR_g19476 [Chara braunii]